MSLCVTSVCLGNQVEFTCSWRQQADHTAEQRLQEVMQQGAQEQAQAGSRAAEVEAALQKRIQVAQAPRCRSALR